jgi:hypothetical protein
MSNVTLRESWIEFGFDYSEGAMPIVPVPVAVQARAEAARIADHFTARLREERRIEEEKRARPTFSNRLLKFVEDHFILALLLFFFVLIPGVAGFIHLLSIWFPSLNWDIEG